MKLTNAQLVLGLIYGAVTFAELGKLAALARRGWRREVAKLEAILVESTVTAIVGAAAPAASPVGTSPAAGPAAPRPAQPESECIRPGCEQDTGAEALMWCSADCQNTDRLAATAAARAAFWAPQEPVKPRPLAEPFPPRISAARRMM